MESSRGGNTTAPTALFDSAEASGSGYATGVPSDCKGEVALAKMGSLLCSHLSPSASN